MAKTPNPQKGKNSLNKPAVDKKEEKAKSINKVKNSSESNNVIMKYL